MSVSNTILCILLKLSGYRIYPECEGGIKNSFPSMTVWHHEACQMMKNGDYEGPILIQILDSLS